MTSPSTEPLTGPATESSTGPETEPPAEPSTEPLTGPATEPSITPPTAPDVLAPAKLGPVTLRNRIIKSATYEGLSRQGLVTDALVDFHVSMAKGGVGMTTVAYCAVAPRGRTDARQIHWRP